MARGGARNRSGPAPQEGSERSERLGYKLTALPAEGYQGETPDWPLEPAASGVEQATWEWAWRTPQACAWSMPSESWRIPFVARWVRLAVRCNEPDAPAGLFASLFRIEDRIGLSTAGLAEMGWKVAVDELAEKAEPEDKPAPRERRLRVADAQ